LKAQLDIEKANVEAAQTEKELSIKQQQTDNQLELGRSQQSLGKAPGGLDDNTLRKEYGIATGE